MKPLLIFAGLCLWIVPAHAQLPDGDGKEIVQTVCTGCHSQGRIISAKKDLSEWQVTIARMIDHGAQLSPDDAELLANYLAKAFPKAPPAKLEKIPQSRVRP